MERNASEQADTKLHIRDFADEVKKIDALVFSSQGHAPATILFPKEYPDGPIPGARVSFIASFLPETPSVDSGAQNVTQFPKTLECYVIWERGIERMLMWAEHEGWGDADLNRSWFLFASALVRARVLHRRFWFRASRARTERSVRKKHIALFGDNAFLELLKLEQETYGRNLTVVEVDMHLTQYLIAAAGQYCNRSEYEGLFELLVSG